MGSNPTSSALSTSAFAEGYDRWSALGPRPAGERGGPAARTAGLKKPLTLVCGRSLRAMDPKDIVRRGYESLSQLYPGDTGHQSSTSPGCPSCRRDGGDDLRPSLAR